MKSLILSLLIPSVAYCAATPGDDPINHSFELGNSSKDFLGTFGGFLGTAVSKNQFLTAAHIGGSINDTFTIGGLSYQTTDIKTRGDLALWTFNGEINNYATISYDNPVNKKIVFWGNGVWVDTSNPIYNGSNLYGYRYDGNSNTRWAENTLSSRFSGDYIRWQTVLGDFERGGLTSGDSGGPVFTFNSDNNGYELVGINYGVSQSLFGPGIMYENQSNYASSTYKSQEWLMNNVNIAPIPEPNQLFFAGLLTLGVLGYMKNRKH